MSGLRRQALAAHTTDQYDERNCGQILALGETRVLSRDDPAHVVQSVAARVEVAAVAAGCDGDLAASEGG